MNKQESTSIYIDANSRQMVVFENNLLTNTHLFISTYPISEKAFAEFIATGTIGLSLQERKLMLDDMQKMKAERTLAKENVKSFYRNLPNDAKISKKQLNEAKMLQEQLKTSTN